MKTKLCGRCKQQKPMTSDYFYNATHTKTGFQAWCKECYKSDEEKAKRKIAQKKWAEKNPGKMSEIVRNWRRRNRSRSNKMIYDWNKNNAEKFLARQKKYQQQEPPGVYAIKYVDDVIYIGATNEPIRRSNIHFSTIKSKNNISKVNKLHSFYGYDKSDFKFEIIEYCDESELFKKEREWRLKLDPKGNYKRIFNIKESTGELVKRLNLTNVREKTWSNPGETRWKKSRN